MTTDIFNITLDIDEINKQIEQETQFPAECFMSEYQDSEYIDSEGKMHPIKFWVLKWRRLDREIKFDYNSRHLIPLNQVRDRRRMSYYEQTIAFANSGYRSKKHANPNDDPKDFIGAKCIIAETISKFRRRDNTDGEVIWWKPIKKYTGESSNNSQEESKEENFKEFLESLSQENWDQIKSLINTKTHIQAVRAISQDSELNDNEQLVSLARSGVLFDYMIEKKMIYTENGKYLVKE